MFAAELDDSRYQARRGYAGNVHTFWPKVAGQNVAVTSPAASWFKRDGTALGALSVTSADVDGVSRLRVTIDASGRDLGEDYRVDWIFTFDGIVHSRTTRLDVVAQPYSPVDDLSLNDLKDAWPDVEPMLLQQAIAQHPDRTAKDQAALLFVRAWALVSPRIRKRVEAEYPENSIASLLVSREDLRPVMVAQAMALAWLADNNGAKAGEWEDRVSKYWLELPALRFDVTQDGVPETTYTGFGVTDFRRGW